MTGSRDRHPEGSSPRRVCVTLFLTRRWPSPVGGVALALSIASLTALCLLVRGTESIVWSVLILVPVLLAGVLLGTLPGFGTGILLALLAGMILPQWVGGIAAAWYSYLPAAIVIGLVGGAVGHLSTLTCEYRTLLAELQALRGIIPICSNCRRVRDDKGRWQELEAYLRSHSDAEFSHGICEACLTELYPHFAGATPRPAHGNPLDAPPGEAAL